MGQDVLLTLPRASVLDIATRRVCYDALASAAVRRGFEALGQRVQELKVYRHAGSRLVVVASIDDTEKFGPLLHVSVSYPDRNPSWREIKAMKEVFFGDDLDAMMVLPRRADWVNVQEFTFHVYQIPGGWGLR